MKTKALLDKYSKLIAGLLKMDALDFKFYTVNDIRYHSSMWKMMLEDKNTIEIKEIEYFEPEKNDKGEETGNQIRHIRWNDWSEGKYVIFCKDKLLSSFELYKLPHCCAILVSCKAYVAEEFRGKRLGTLLNNMRQDIGKLLGYSVLMCTDIEANIHQRQLLATNGWKDIHDVKNKRTGNKVYLSVINL